MTTIRYFIPEDGDSEDQPNVFLAPKPSQPGLSPRLAEIRNAFPLPGQYHFRFKSPVVPGSDRDKDCVAVWMDCVDDNQHVGVWRNTIFAKVTRISLEKVSFTEDISTSSVNVPNNMYHSVEASSTSTASVSSTTSSPTNTPAASTETLLDVFDEPVPKKNVVQATDHVANLLDVDPPATISSNRPIEGSLLDMDGPVYAPVSQPIATSTSSAHLDFLGMTATPSVQSSLEASVSPVPMPPRTNPVQSSVPLQIPSNPASAKLKLPPSRSGSSNAFDSFVQKSGPFGDLGWK